MAQANWFLALIEAYGTLAGVPELSFSRQPESTGLPCVTLSDPHGEHSFIYTMTEALIDAGSEKSAQFSVWVEGQENCEMLAATIRAGLPPGCLQTTTEVKYELMLTRFQRMGEQPALAPGRQKVFLIEIDYRVTP